MRNIFVIIFVLLGLSACGGKSHPKMLSFTPASVVIDYSNNDLHEATSFAQQFCSSINRDAQYVRTEKSGWISETREAFFNCIESTLKNNQNSNAFGGATPNNSNMPIINNFK